MSYPACRLADETGNPTKINVVKNAKGASLIDGVVSDSSQVGLCSISRKSSFLRLRLTNSLCDYEGGNPLA